MDLSVISTFDFRSALPAPALAGFVGLRLFGVDVAFVHQLLDQPVQQLVHLLGRHVLERFLDLLGLLGIEHLALFERALDGVLQIFERVLVPLAETHVLDSGSRSGGRNPKAP